MQELLIIVHDSQWWIIAKLFDIIKNKDLEFVPEECWEQVSPDVIELLKKMLQKDPAKRIHIEQVVNHKAFRSLPFCVASPSYSKTEKKRVTNYLNLSPIERKFMRYSTKFIPVESCYKLKERFMELDSNNSGTIPCPVNNKKKTNLSLAHRSSSCCTSNSDYQGKELTYSDFLASMLSADLLCSDENIENVFHALNPTHLCDDVFKTEVEKALFGPNEDPLVISGFKDINPPQRSSK